MIYSHRFQNAVVRVWLVASSFALLACGDRVPAAPGTGPGTGPTNTGTGPAPGSGGNNADLSLQIQPGQGILARGGNFVVALAWLKGPFTTSANSVQLTFADKNRRALSSFVIQKVFPWNVSTATAGDDSQIVLAPSLRTPTIITVSNFALSGAGQWTLTVNANANGVSDTADVPVGFVR